MRAEQISVRNPDGTFTLDMWGVSYAAPMNDLSAHPPMALFRYMETAREYPEAGAGLDRRLLRVTVGPWVEPPFAPKKGDRVIGTDFSGTEWEAPYLCSRPKTMGGVCHYLGTHGHNIEVMTIRPVGAR